MKYDTHQRVWIYLVVTIALIIKVFRSEFSICCSSFVFIRRLQNIIEDFAFQEILIANGILFDSSQSENFYTFIHNRSQKFAKKIYFKLFPKFKL